MSDRLRKRIGIDDKFEKVDGSVTVFSASRIKQFFDFFDQVLVKMEGGERKKEEKERDVG